MSGPRQPLPTLLSQALVAFTIEFDNEFEHRMPHRTTNHGSTPGSRPGPWLVSMAMWSNCMQFVGEEGVRASDLPILALTGTNLNGMQRWGYVVEQDGVILATASGREAQSVWQPLFDIIEKRWEDRFGKAAVEDLRKALRTTITKIDLALPDCLPILVYGLFSRGPGHAGARSGLTLPAMLSQVLLAIAMEFERESYLSLAICADLLRVLNEEGVRVRDLPSLSGVSKEAIQAAMGILQKGAWAVVVPDPAGSKARMARLTPKGRTAQDAYHRLLSTIEERWEARYGQQTIGRLRAALERLTGDPARRSPLFDGLEPYPGGWRASVRKPDVLPHYPMVLHRGGFPDGS